MKSIVCCSLAREQPPTGWQFNHHSPIQDSIGFETYQVPANSWAAQLLQRQKGKRGKCCRMIYWSCNARTAQNLINILLNVLCYMTDFKWYTVWQFSRWPCKHTFLLQSNIRWSLYRLIHEARGCSGVHSPDKRFPYLKLLSWLCTGGFFLASQEQKNKQRQKNESNRTKEENSQLHDLFPFSLNQPEYLWFSA